MARKALVRARRAMASPTVTSDECSQNSDPDEERAEEPYQPLCVLKFGKNYPYTIPSFSVITVQLRHAIVQGEDDDGLLKVADAFFREDTTLLSVTTPKLVKVKFGCLVEVDEFTYEIEMDIRTVNDGVLVVWEWEWKDSACYSSYLEMARLENDNENDTDGEGYENDTGAEKSDPESEESDDNDRVTESRPESDLPLVTHTVTFKCIGAHREEYQDTLREARNRLAKGFTVLVRLNPEPHNVKDSKAIAFQCELDGKWIRIGYVVKELLDHVHAALSDKKILNVRFSWIKYITDWRRPGPGYFAGINISKNGDWDPIISQYSSTR